MNRLDQWGNGDTLRMLIQVNRYLRKSVKKKA